MYEWKNEWMLLHYPHQLSSVAQSCLTLHHPMECSIPGFSVHHQLLELTETHVHQVSDAIQPSHPLLSPSPPLQSSPESGSFQMSQFFALGGQSIRASASAQSFQWIFRVDFFFFFWIDCFVLLVVQRTLKSLLQHHNLKTSLQNSAFFMV